MSLDKAIEHGREHRKSYCRNNGSYAKAVFKACRNHGSCSWCLGNRTYKNNKKEEATRAAIRDWECGTEPKYSIIDILKRHENEGNCFIIIPIVWKEGGGHE